MEQTIVRPGEPLEGTIDVEREADAIPLAYTVKGLFFMALVKMLGAEGLASVTPSLARPPRGGRYVAFQDYPQADYTRVACAVASRKYPGVGLREGMRRLAREDFTTLSTSTFGKVVMTLVRDARGALHKVPSVYERVAPGHWTVTASDLDDHTVRIEFQDYPADWAYTVGQLEGVVQHYGTVPETLVTTVAPQHVRFDVRHR